jgi:RNA polymerase sigma-70 factor (ECF subfamily)
VNASKLDSTVDREAFDRLLVDLRPKLHRYCARMTGSVVDGEDVVQEALLKAVVAFPDQEPIAHFESWLFRISHNTALDHLRHRARRDATYSNEDPDMIADPVTAVDQHQTATTSLRTFMRLPAAQRSCVILMDVLGYSLEEISSVIEGSVPAVKAALHRGRARLRELVKEPEDLPLPVLAEPERSLLANYIAKFNARDFDAIRNMLGDEVRLDLVARTQMTGRREVGTYFQNYSSIHDWHLAPGFVDGRPAVLVHDPREASATPAYFVLLQWAGDRVGNIRDFRYARYATEGAELVTAR